MIKNLAELEPLKRNALSALWYKLYSMDPPKNLSIEMMRQFIAFEYQAKPKKGLNAKAQRKFKQLQNTTKSVKSVSHQLEVGAQILRDWNGVTHKVKVRDKGFCWQGTDYKSLTQIAKLITGTHWSGPRFFGLNKKVKSTNG